MHLFHVLLAHVLGVSRVLRLQEDGEQLEHRLLHRQRRVLEPLLTNLTQSLGHDGAKSLLEEGDRVLLLLEVVEAHGFLFRRDFDGKLSLGVTVGLEQELLELLFRAELELLALVTDDEVRVAIDQLLLISQCDWTVVEQCLFSVSDFRCFMTGHTFRDVSGRREDHIISELARVGHK